MALKAVLNQQRPDPRLEKILRRNANRVLPLKGDGSDYSNEPQASTWILRC